MKSKKIDFKNCITYRQHFDQLDHTAKLFILDCEADLRRYLLVLSDTNSTANDKKSAGGKISSLRRTFKQFMTLGIVQSYVRIHSIDCTQTLAKVLAERLTGQTAQTSMLRELFATAGRSANRKTSMLTKANHEKWKVLEIEQQAFNTIFDYECLKFEASYQLIRTGSFAGFTQRSGSMKLQIDDWLTNFDDNKQMKAELVTKNAEAKSNPVKSKKL